MKNKIKIILVLITLLLLTSASAQTNYSFSIADILSSMPNGKRLPDGTIVKAELITTGGATHSTGPSGSGTAGPDIGGLFTGNTLPAYVGDKTPTNFTKIQMANTLNADNGMANNCSASIGFRIYFDRPVESINFLALDIDGVHGTPNGNAEWVTFFGYNGNTFVPYANAVSGGNTQLVNQTINIGASHSWRTLINNSLGTIAGANLPSTITIRRQTPNGGSGTPDDLNHQVLFTPPLSTTHVTDFFLMTGIWSVTAQANVQASGLSPIVITISSDFGDAPDSYKTLLASDGASHGVVGTLSLGNTNFAEPDGLPSVLADASIDDDGVQVIPPLTNNGQNISSYTVAANFNNNTGLPANYVAWIDWNNDGVFQASEGTTATSPAGTLSGSVNLTWNNVALTNTGGHAQTYLRVRVTTEAITTSDSGSSFMNGEVEDYAIGIPATTPDFACFNVGTSSGFINVLANDTSGSTIVPETVGFVNPGTGTNLIIDGFGDIVGITIPGEGVWKANSVGLISFEPESASVINPTPIAYLGRDAQGNISNSALITLTAASIPTNTTTVTEGCFPTTLTATASVPAGQSVVWYDAALAGNIVASPVLSTVGTVTYYAQGNNGSCTSAVRTPVTLAIAAPPNPGTLLGFQNICQGTSTNYVTNGDVGGIWSSSDPTIATVNASGVVTGLMPGVATITYTVAGTGGCSDLSSTRAITIEDAPDSGTLTGNQNICVGGTSAFSSDGAPGGIWESDDLAIATVDVNGVVTGVSRGTTLINYTIVQTGSCSVIPSTISVTIIESNPGTLSGNQNVCVGETTTFTTDGDSGGVWTTDDAGIASVDVNGVITGNATGSTIITYTVNGSSGCPSASTTRTVTVNVNAPATAADITGADTEICPGDNATLSVSSATVINPVFTWYADQTTSTILNNGASYNVSPTVTTTYYVSVKGDATCENDPNTRKPILVTVNALGIASDITAADAIICLGSTASLTASSSTVTNPVFRWYASQTSTAVLSTGVSYNPSPIATTTYYVSVSGDGVCENVINTRKAVVVNVTPLATQLDLTANDRTICNGSSVSLTASSSNVVSPVFRWYADQTSTTVLNTGPSYNVSPITTTTYYVSVSGTGMCENLPNFRKAVSANVNPLGQASDITALDAITCPGQTVALTASSATVTSPIFRWYADQTTTIALSTGASYSPSPTVTTTYYVSVSGTGVCENAPNTRKAVTISMNPLATAADINTTDQTICTGDAALLIATSAIDSPVFIWYESQTSTNPLFVGDYYDPTPTVTTTYYVSVRGTNICDNAINTRKAVTVTVNSLGLASDITAADATICSGSSASLTASSATVTTPVFRWYADQTTTTVLSTGASYSPSPTVTTSYYLSVSGDEVCENLPNTRKAVTVTVNSLGLASDITAADATICSGSSASLTASSATVATPVFRWYADQTTTTVLSTGASYSPSPTATTSYYVSVSGDGVCENLPNTRKAVMVTVNSLGLASDITAADAMICSGSSASLSASSATVTTPVFRWYADQTTTTVLST
ncbi:S-layer family protein, partial [Flavobacterium sp. IB48]|uniref:beta strand repeat-containing protein n=1 Tax=Flavobacterium sp. IB48 TaxID=2779375 RepID=UPI0018E76232